MAKTRGKGNQMLNAAGEARFNERQTTVGRRQASQRDEFYAQEYADKVLAAYDKYTSSMHKIHDQLRTAQAGLEKIDEKGMAEDIIIAIEKIEKLQRLAISTTSAYTTELAGYDSERLESIKKGNVQEDIFVAESIDMRIKAKNAEVKKSLAELDAQYNELESTITATKDYTPTDEDILNVRRQQKDILTQKQDQLCEYANFMQQTAKYRDKVIDPVRRRREEEEALAKEILGDNKVETPEETKAKAEVVTSAFANAQEKANQRWEAFKAAPGIHQIVSVGSFVAGGIAKKTEPWRNDIKAAYAMMKERKQMRKVEKDLARLDELSGVTGEESHVARFKAMLSGKDKVAEPETKVSEEAPVLVPVTEAEPEVKAEESVTEVAPAEEPKVVEPETAESLHDKRVRAAANKATLQAFDGSGLRSMINDYYWSDVSETHDVMKELESSDNVMNDLTQYTDRLKKVISHFPNKKLRESLNERINTAMTATYQAKTEAERKVSAAEARIRDSQAFLAELDGHSETQAEDVQTEAGI